MKWTDQSPSALLPIVDDAIRGHFGDGSAIRELFAQTRAGTDLDVAIEAPVHHEVLQHLRASRVEQGGLLLGTPYGAPGNPASPALVVISAVVPARHASGTGYSLRMEAAVWSDANRLLELGASKQPGTATEGSATRVVGWYHSHPGLGAFFSDTDCATQRAFFSHPWSVGWVIDPDDDTHACFAGVDSSAVRRCYLVRKR